MRAIVQHEYGAPQDVLRLAEVAMPVAGAEDVLVSVRASSANPWDWHFIRGEPIQPGQHVLIIGASGGVGTFAVQIARHLGAQVTGVCSARHVDVVRRLGAQHVIDYTRQDVTTGAAHYDLAIQLGGTYSPAAVKKALTPRGTLIQSFGDGSRWFGPVGNIIKAVALNALAGQTLKSFTAKVTAQALREVGDLIESGHITPVIDRTYPLTDAAAAVELVEEGSPAGKVIVVVEPPAPELPLP